MFVSLGQMLQSISKARLAEDYIVHVGLLAFLS
jgi:hypothetical protein